MTTAPDPYRVGGRSLLVAGLLLLAACANHHREATFRPTHSALADLPARAPPGQEGNEANDVLIRAIGLVGTPYHWGGNTPDGGFDCSGLVGYIYRQSTGMILPRTSSAMASMDRPKVRRQARLISGDLVFFGRHGHISHVGVYVGKGRFVHAPNSGGTVRLDDIDGPYWRNHFAYGRRVLD